MGIARVSTSRVSTSMPHGSFGRPLLIGDFDGQVAACIRQLREAEAIVNFNIIIAAAKGIISHINANLLKESGGNLDLGKKTGLVILHRRNFVKRKATKAARKQPVDFSELKLFS